MKRPDGILTSADLSARNTLASPGRAGYLIEIRHEDQVAPALAWARTQGLAVHVLGGGSNILVPDQVTGLVLVSALRGVRPVTYSDTRVTVDVGAGESWHEWVCNASARGWYGLENLALIPGTVGAAPVQNIGAYGVEVGTWIESVRAVDLHTGAVRDWRADECGFAYRDSVFKSIEPGRWLILRVRFRLQRQFTPVLDYGPLTRLAEPALKPGELLSEVVAIRRSKLPDPAQVPNAGSFFTNPVVSADQVSRLSRDWPDLPLFRLSNGRAKLAAGWLIEQCGFKGIQDPLTGVGTWPQQALILINPRHQPMSAVLAFSARIRAAVQAHFGVDLVPEPQRLDRV